MSDQATKLRSIFGKQTNTDSEVNETNELESEIVKTTPSDVLNQEDASLEPSASEDKINESIEESLPSLEETMTIETAQEPVVTVEVPRKISVLSVVSDQSISDNLSVVIHLGVQLQQLNNRVCMIDLDGQIFNYFNENQIKRPTLTDVINQKGLLKEAIIDGPQHMKIIQSGDFIFDSMNFEDGIKHQLDLFNDIDFLLINVETDLTRATMVSLLFAQEVMLLGEADLSAIKEAYRFLKTINKYRVKPFVRILLEKKESMEEVRKGFNLLAELTQQFLDLNISSLGCINTNRLSSSREEIRLLADKVQHLSLFNSQRTTTEQVFNKLIGLCQQL